MELKTGQILDGFTLVHRLGSGATADVWKVVDSADKPYALKLYSPQQRLDSFSRQLFLDEFRTSLTLKHPNVVTSEKIGEFEDRPFIVMQYCASSLDAELKRRILERNRGNAEYADQLFSEEELATILNQVAWGIDYIHKENVIHNDIKPANVLIDPFLGESSYKIADFGISTRLRQTVLQQSQVIEAHNKSLTPSYAAPEKFAGKVHRRSDIYSLGVMMYELATGNLPDENDHYAIGELQLKGQKAPELIGTKLSARFKSLLKSCLNSNHRLRPETTDLTNQTKIFLTKGFWPDLKLSQKDTKDDHSIIEAPQRPPKQKKKFRRIPFGRKAIALLLIALTGLGAIGGFFAVRAANVTSARLFESGNIAMALTASKRISWISPQAKDRVKVLESVQEEFDYVRPFSEHLAAAKSNNGKWGFIDEHGVVQIGAQFDYVGNFETVNSDFPITYFEKGGKDRKIGFLKGDGSQIINGFSFCTLEISNDSTKAIYRLNGVIKSDDLKDLFSTK